MRELFKSKEARAVVATVVLLGASACSMSGDKQDDSIVSAPTLSEADRIQETQEWTLYGEELAGEPFFNENQIDLSFKDNVLSKVALTCEGNNLVFFDPIYDSFDPKTKIDSVVCDDEVADKDDWQDVQATLQLN